MNDDPHSDEELDAEAAERIGADRRGEAEETSFRLAVARRFYQHGQDTAQIAADLAVDEAAVYNVLDSVRKRSLE